MKITFTKMHGCGNDYIYISNFPAGSDTGDPREDTARKEASHILPPDKRPELVRRLSDRHFGIGGDGVIFINPPSLNREAAEAGADCEMEMYNADGSRAEMCGNGIRCVAKYVYDKGLVRKSAIRIYSADRVRTVQVFARDGLVREARVDMGEPVFKAVLIPVVSRQEEVLDAPIRVADRLWHMSAVSMGNPHAVVWAEDTPTLDLNVIGPLFEHHPCFPERVNTEFIRILNRREVLMRVWERGAGETLACGTGACATAVACSRLGLTDRTVKVLLRGGALSIEWEKATNHVFLTGPAESVFEGTVWL